MKKKQAQKCTLRKVQFSKAPAERRLRLTGNGEREKMGKY